jgi:hypothetical protein
VVLLLKGDDGSVGHLAIAVELFRPTTAEAHIARGNDRYSSRIENMVGELHIRSCSAPCTLTSHSRRGSKFPTAVTDQPNEAPEWAGKIHRKEKSKVRRGRLVCAFK